jgi:hypothetical protein
MASWKGRKQSPEHVAKRVAAKRASYQPITPAMLWAKVDKRGPDECWPWRDKPDEGGYGHVYIAGVSYLAHRAIFNLANPGVIELRGPKQNYKGKGFILHGCDNPICCNPSHLRVGTHKENIEDRQRRDRQKKWGPDEHPRCKLTIEDAEEIRKLRGQGVTGRSLAKRYGVSPQTISSINVGRFYCV